MPGICTLCQVKDLEIVCPKCQQCVHFCPGAQGRECIAVVDDPLPSRRTADAWAATLTNSRLAADLSRMAGNIRFHTADERDAILKEASRRLNALP